MAKLSLFSLANLLFALIIFQCVISQSKLVMGSPLYTDSRWIVDGEGRRVKLACVNWPSHIDAVLAEGLSKQPLDAISKRIVSMGFNCVRFTWPTFLFTSDSLGALTVRQSFQNLNLSQALAGIEYNNPFIIDLPLRKAFEAVVYNLGANHLMAILDNHISKPGWCCSLDDGNGFFGDEYFNVDVWLKGLNRVASMFKGFPNVVGMSLRNELRGSRQNVDDWFRYMQQGAETVHAANPNVLVILSGLSYDLDLSFLGNRSVDLSFTNKLVFEAHRYKFSDTPTWANHSADEACGIIQDDMMSKSGFLLDKGFPLFVSEFGIDESANNATDESFMNCFLSYAAEHDLDWAIWALTGSYYIRQGKTNTEETFGLLNFDWSDVQNPRLLQRISTIQSPFKGPGLPGLRGINTGQLTNTGQLIFHPSTGLCVIRRSVFELIRRSVIAPLTLGPCTHPKALWSYTPEKTISLYGADFCIQADRPGKPGKLSNICFNPDTKWEAISDSKLHLSSTVGDGKTVCLDVDFNTNNVVTNRCKCLSDDTTCDPSSQWFKLIKI
ncbi:hypothetical protein CMV_011891 [Castanea mollissima]|uniref:Glycoside hydrolase family 5 domain-containing protein n=1 Tax=Castanea mollissima TaxID=60419 RepID=A0A8J4VNS3_9ROSI|nr:hypothetical protein CMV_011891 [Castanea mollissima]